MHWMIKPIETLTLFEVMHTSSFWKIMSMIWCIPLMIIAAILYKTYRKSHKGDLYERDISSWERMEK